MARRKWRGRVQDPEPQEAVEQAAEQQRRPLVVRKRALALILLVLGGTIVIALDRPVQLPQVLDGQWPTLLVIGGAIVLLIGMITTWQPGALVGPLISAVGLVFLLEQQGQAASLTLLAGALLAATGVAIVARGLTLARR